MGSVDVVAVATPFATGDVPNVVPPLVNITVPVTFVGSVAVKITDWSKLVGFADETSAIDGEAFDTV